MALPDLRVRLATLTRAHNTRDSHGRFASTGVDNLTGDRLTTEQHAAAVAALDTTTGRGTGICGRCTKLLNGPRKGEHLGVVPVVRHLHYNDALCPTHMHHTLHTFYVSRGLSAAQAQQRAEAQVRSSWSAEDLAALGYTTTPDGLRLRLATLVRRRGGGGRGTGRHTAKPRSKGRQVAKHRTRKPHVRKAKAKTPKAHLAKLKVAAPKLPDITNIHGAQGTIINNIGSGMTGRLVSLQLRQDIARTLHDQLTCATSAK